MKTALMFSYFFLIIALIYILKPVRSALFLDQLGAENLRYVYIGEGVFLFFVVAMYIQLAKRLPKRIFFPTMLGFFISNLALFWLLFHMQVPYLAAFFYIWVASFSITMTTQFWILANDIFNPAEAKRLFGLIISGGSLGGVLGGLFTQQAVRWVKTEDLLLVAASVLVLCILLVAVLWRLVPQADGDGTSRNASKTDQVAKTNSSAHEGPVLKLFQNSSYLIMLAALVVTAKMASTIVDNQFNGMVELSVHGKEAKTAFFGGFLAWLNTLSFMMQLFFTSIFLRYLGVGISLWVLPVGLLLFLSTGFIYPVLGTALALKCFDGSVNYSIQQASKEVLFLPLTSQLRYRVKPVIDMLGFRAAKAFSGIYIAIFAPIFGLSSDKLGVLVLALIPFWFFLVMKMRKGYSEQLRNRLVEKRKEEKDFQVRRATDVLSFLHDEKAFHEIRSFMEHPSTYARKIAATACLTYAESQDSLESTRRVVRRMVEEEAFDDEEKESLDKGLNSKDILFLEKLVLSETEEKAPDIRSLQQDVQKGSEELLMKLAGVLRDSETTLFDKRRTVRILSLIPKQESVDILLHHLASSRNHALRFVIVTALDRLHAEGPWFRMNRFLIKHEIARETKIHQKLQKLLAFYRKQKQGRKGADEQGSLEVALKSMLDESLERIFRYLDLLYPHEIIEDIYDRIANYPDTDPVRNHAIELLSNTLEPGVLMMLHRIMDSKVPEPKDPEVSNSLKEFASSEDRWFSLISLFIISELNLSKRWPSLAAFSIKSKLKELLD